MFLQSWAQLAEHEEETACGGAALAVLVRQLAIRVFQTASYKKWKKNLYNVYLTIFCTCKGLQNRRVRGFLFVPAIFRLKTEVTAVTVVQGRVPLAGSDNNSCPALVVWHQSCSGSVCKIRCDPLDECSFWSPTRATGSRSSGYQSHLQYRICRELFQLPYWIMNLLRWVGPTIPFQWADTGY